MQIFKYLIVVVDDSVLAAPFMEQSHQTAIVSSHEREHVANAIAKGSKPGAKLISASVALKMEVCPECGTSYVAGGTTTTQIKYSKSNPYDKNADEAFGNLLVGNNVDEKV